MYAYQTQKAKLGNQEHTFMRGAKLADEHPHWISVEDDLPKMEHDFNTWSCSKEVLVFTPIGDYCIRRWEYDKRDDRFYWAPRTAFVTHWMPLPEPVVSKMENTGKKGGEA